MNVLNNLNPLHWFRRRKAEPKGMQQVYTDAAGIRYFQFRDPTATAMSRAVAAEHALRFAELGINKNKFKEHIATAKQCLQSGDAVKLAQIIMELDLYSEAIAEQNALLEVAACFILQDGEPPEYDGLLAADKIERWKRSPADRDFFLLAGWKSTRQYSVYSDIDILSYLRGVANLNKSTPQHAKQAVRTSMKSTSPPSGSPGAASQTSKSSKASASPPTTRNYKLPSN
jgi:hypothetical protein